MNIHRIAALTMAALICAPAVAQSVDGSPARQPVKPGKARGGAAKEPAKRAPAAAAPSRLLGPDRADEDRASSLERRRKAFFAPQPDDGGSSADRPTPSAGVMLGGSNGLTPGMGFKF